MDVRYKDYRDDNRHKVMTLSGEELIRRFLLHVLPKGFMRVRHFGFQTGLPGPLFGADPHGASRPGAGTCRSTGGHRTL